MIYNLKHNHFQLGAKALTTWASCGKELKKGSSCMRVGKLTVNHF